MVKVNPDISKNLLAELTMQRPARVDLRVMKLHVGAQTTRMGICLAADRTGVRATVGVTVHVALEMVLELKAAAAGRAMVEWTTSWLRGLSQLEGDWGGQGGTFLCLG